MNDENILKHQGQINDVTDQVVPRELVFVMVAMVTGFSSAIGQETD